MVIFLSGNCPWSCKAENFPRDNLPPIRNISDYRLGLAQVWKMWRRNVGISKDIVRGAVMVTNNILSVNATSLINILNFWDCFLKTPQIELTQKQKTKNTTCLQLRGLQLLYSSSNFKLPCFASALYCVLHPQSLQFGDDCTSVAHFRARWNDRLSVSTQASTI